MVSIIKHLYVSKNSISCVAYQTKGNFNLQLDDKIMLSFYLI